LKFDKLAGFNLYKELDTSTSGLTLEN